MREKRAKLTKNHYNRMENKVFRGGSTPGKGDNGRKVKKLENGGKKEQRLQKSH